MDYVNKYVFISGTGRSGTNITKEILADHPDIYALPFEYRFTVDPDGIISTYNILKNVWSPFQVDIAIKRLEILLRKMGQKNRVKSLTSNTELTRSNGKSHSSTPYAEWELSKWFPNYNNLVDKLITGLTDVTYNGYWPGAISSQQKNVITMSLYDREDVQLESIFHTFLTKLYDGLLKKHKSSCLVEDNTWSVLYAKDLVTILPNLKLIHVVRDPRDVLASMIHQRWCPSDLMDCIKFYQSLFKRIFSQLKLISDKNYVQIKLENMVCNKQDSLGLISNFIGVDIRNIDQNNKLNTGTFGRWKRDFNSIESALINKHLEYEICTLEYK